MILHGFGPTPDTYVAFDFLAKLYAKDLDGGWLSLFAIDRISGQRETAWAPLDRIFTLEPALGRLAPRADVWFGVAPRERELTEGRRGGVSDCVGIPALWLDIDVKSDVHKLPGLCPTYDDARRLALSWAIPPSLVVRSGYGFQCWWLLEESILAADAVPILAQWNHTWQQIAASKEVHLDNTSNIDRVMRLPGTFNHKGADPVAVTFKGQAIYYPIEAITGALLHLPDREERPRAYTGHLAGTKMNDALDLAVILEMELGCTRVSTDGAGNDHWHYPNSENDTSCTVYAEDNHLTIWSETMASELGMEIRRPYDPFGFWVRLKFEGDFAAAHTWLVEHDIKDAYTQRQSKPAKPLPGQLKAVGADTVTPQRVQWVWHGWLPAGKLTVLDGDPDIGKSTLSLDIAARVTKGAPMPDGTQGVGPADVVLLSGEDDLEDTIVWRLKAAGADLSRITHVQAALEDDGEESPLTIPRDLPLIERLVASRSAAVVIVDVLNEYLDERVDGHKDQSVRRALQHVRSLAQHTGAAVLALRHLRKESSPKAIYRGGGSIGIIGAARAGWTVANHPEDESIRVLAAVKMNLALRPQALMYKLIGHEEYPCAYVDWRGGLDISADELLDPSQRKSRQEEQEAVTSTRRCIDAIEMFLPVGKENAMLSNELKKMVLDSVECSEKTYKSAHTRVVFGRSWQVILPNGIRGTMVWRPDPEKGDFQ